MEQQRWDSSETLYTNPTKIVLILDLNFVVKYLLVTALVMSQMWSQSDDADDNQLTMYAK